MKIVFLLALGLMSIFCANAQQNEIDVRKLIDEFCLCIHNGKTKEGRSKCLLILEPLKRLTSISHDDSLYVQSASKNCGREKNRNQCNFLQESDLSTLRLKKVMESMGRIEWESDVSGDNLIEALSDYRENFSSEDEAKIQVAEHKKKISEHFELKLVDQQDEFNEEIYTSEWIGDMTLYHVYMRNKNLTGYTLITVKSADNSLVKEVVGKIRLRMRDNCLN